VRALAAANILFFHFWNPAWFGPLAPMADNGYASVDFFFILSGFILTYNYADKQAQGKFQRREFWRARLVRLYPVYLLGLLVSLPVLQLEWKYQTTGNFFQGVFLTSLMQQGWSPLLATFWNTPAWTLSCEVMFYLVFPWALARAWPRGRWRLALVLVALWLTALALPLLYMGLHPDGAGPLNRYSGGYWLRAVKFTPLPHLPSFLFGIALSYWNDRLQLTDRMRFAMAVVSMAGIVFCLMQGEKLPFLLTHDGLLAPLFGGLILGLAGTHPLAGLLSLRPLVLLGEASFCLYILHFNLWQWVHSYGLLALLHVQRWDPWVSYLLLELAALAAYRWVEQPGRGWMQRMVSLLERATPATTGQ
jgi:peptidoglycan/LPS O-acetylase OafA/YrhL